jgi:hypothetical protein
VLPTKIPFNEITRRQDGSKMVPFSKPRGKFRLRPRLLLLLAALLLFASVASATTTHPKPSTTKSKQSKSKHSKKSTTKKTRGQRSIDQERARQIQTALIREHYLEDEPNGNWDQRTKDAMQKYQAANGWQTKVMPDSRALIKLRLGPSRENVINPETAATTPLAPASVPAADTPGGPQPFRQ